VTLRASLAQRVLNLLVVYAGVKEIQDVMKKQQR
jgi:hypothetical protein